MKELFLVILSLTCLVSLASILYPFKPFRTRKNAIFAFLGSFVAVGVLSTPDTSSTGTIPIRTTAIASSNAGDSISIPVKLVSKPVSADLNYRVIDSNIIPGTKLSLVVRLSQKVTENELRQIAQELKCATPGSYARMFITYYLPGMEPGAGAWATTHYNPSLKVVIQGMTLEQENNLAKITGITDQDMIGMWANESVGSANRLYRKGGKIFYRIEFSDGSKFTREMIKRSTTSGQRFDMKERNASGDYLLLKPSGDLEIRDSLGLITIARPIG